MGQVAEIRYLYVAGSAGSLYQPIYLGSRDDITVEKQRLKYRQANRKIWLREYSGRLDLQIGGCSHEEIDISGKSRQTCNGIVHQLKYRGDKRTLDAIGTAVQSVEHALNRDSVTLPGFGRSFQVDEFSCGAQTAFLSSATSEKLDP